MTTVTFDTQELVNKLRAAGFPQEQADAVVRAITEAQSELGTKADLRELEQRLRAEMASIDGKLTVLIGLNIAMALAVIGPYLAKFFA